MPLREEAPIGSPCWVDVLTTDPARTQEFYGRLFGWTVEDPGEEYGGYFNFQKDGVYVAGGMRNDGASGVPDLWSVYLATDDADATVAGHRGRRRGHGPGDGRDGARAHGRRRRRRRCGDRDVATRPAQGVRRHGRARRAGVVRAPHTRYDASVGFYRDVFGWSTQVASDTPEFRYTTMDVGGEQLAGIMDASAFLPEGVPSGWTAYFAVDDTDATLSEVVALGGEVVTAAEDSPYGRLATVADATGVCFRVIAR